MMLRAANWVGRLLLIGAVVWCGASTFACAIDSVPLPEVDRDASGGGVPPEGGDGDGDGVAPGEPATSTGDMTDTDSEAGRFSDRIQSNHIYYAFAPARSAELANGAPAHTGARVVATAGALPGKAAWRLFAWGQSSDDPNAWQVQGQATVQGSFYADIPASPGTRIGIEISETIDGMQSKIGTLVLALEPASVDANRVELMLADVASDPPPAPTPEPDQAWPQNPDAGVIARAPNSIGEVLVQGGAGSLVLGTAVVVANPTNGSAQVAYPYADGSFATRVAAAGGDSLELFVVEPATSNGGGSLLQVSVLTSP